MITWTSFLTILGMLVVTYSTRLIGFFALRNRKLSPRMARTMEAAPACVLLAVIAPHFVSPHPHEWLAMAITVWAAWRLPMLQTVLLAVGSSALLGWLFSLFQAA